MSKDEERIVNSTMTTSSSGFDLLESHPESSADPDDLSLSVATIIRPEKQDERIISDQPRNIPKNHSHNIPKKLCGWLVRHKRKGFLKSSDKKWYDFADDRCKLYSYQGPDEVTPLDSVDIARCAVTVDPEFSEIPGVFALKNSGEGLVWILQAVSTDEMKTWVVELQRRREFYLKARSLDALKSMPGNILRSEQTVDAPSRSVDDENCSSASVSDYDFCDSRDNITLASGNSNSFVSFDDLFIRRTNTYLPAVDQMPPSLTPSKSTLDAPNFNVENGMRSPKSNPLNSFRQMFNPVEKSSKGLLKNEKALEDRVLVLKDELLITKEDLVAQKEIVRVLRRQLDFTTKEKEALKSLAGSTDKESAQMEILRDRCRLILELEEALQNSRLENQTVFQRNEIIKTELVEMAKQNAKLREELRTKDHAILILNEQLAKQDDASAKDIKTRSLSQRSVLENDEQFQKLRDTLEVYKGQLTFLNEEIVNQNTLRTEMINREELLLATLLEWEAKYARLESRHLFTLKSFTVEKAKLSIDHVKSDEDRIRDRILEEALEGSETDSHIKAVNNCDKYGFFVSRLHYTDEEFLERKGLEAERKEKMVNVRKDAVTASHLIRWENHLAKQTVFLQSGEELKSLMRIGCPTDEIRQRSWKSCVLWRVASIKQVKGNNYYQSLVKDNSTPIASSAAKQIKIDLCRTLPNNVHFMNMDSDLIPKLEQGMNRLVAIALMFLNEEDAFWCLVAIVDYLLPGYFTMNMIEAQVDQRILRDLFAEKFPKLNAHLSPLIDITLYSFNWFLTIFVDNVHPDVFLPIWDAFLVEGRKVLFRYSLAMFKYFEDKLLDISDQTVANKFLRSVGDNVTDVRRLQSIAFEGLNPFPLKLIRARRAVHLPEIMREMQQLERLRASVTPTPLQDEDDN